MSELRPGSHERAWNDPPVLAYNASTSSKPIRNRRPAHPALGGGPSSLPPTAPVPIGNLPPVGSPVSPSHLPPFMPGLGVIMGTPPNPSLLMSGTSPKAIVGTPPTVNAAGEFLDKNIDSAEVWNRLDARMQIILAKFDLDETRKEEILKRLKPLEPVLKEDRLERPALVRLSKVLDGLESHDFSVANAGYRALSVDCPSAASWSVALRQLIAIAKEKDEQVFS